MNPARPNPPEYYGNATQLAELEEDNIATGTKFFVFDEEENVLVRAYVFVEGIGWCTYTAVPVEE